jgi:hypothetical protein
MKRFLHGLFHSVALAQIPLHQVGNDASWRQFVCGTCFQTSSNLTQSTHQHTISRDLTRQPGFRAMGARAHFLESTPSIIQTLGRAKCNSWKGTKAVASAQ